jgi:hypothetical protein
MRNRNQEWANHRAKLKVEFEDDGTTTCELRFSGCTYDNFLSFAHKEKRSWYYPLDREPLLGDKSHVILACTNCHDKIENNKDLSDKMFEKLRG